MPIFLRLRVNLSSQILMCDKLMLYYNTGLSSKFWLFLICCHFPVLSQICHFSVLSQICWSKHKSYTQIYSRLQCNDIASEKIKHGTRINANILSITWSDHEELSRGLCLRHSYSGNSFYRPSELKLLFW